MKGILTSLKLALPAAFVLLLAGCITDPYQYRGGYGGDYYYGRPSVEYRHHDYYGPYGYGGYGYGHPYYGRSGWSFGLSYGYPYGYSRYGYGRYGYGYGGWPYYYRGWPGHPPIVVRPGTGHDPDPGHEPGPGGDSDQGPAPWRDLARLRDLNPGPRMLSEPDAPRIRYQAEEREPAPEPMRVRAPRPMAEAAPRPVRSSRIERVQQMARERDNEP